VIVTLAPGHKGGSFWPWLSPLGVEAALSPTRCDPTIIPATISPRIVKDPSRKAQKPARSREVRSSDQALLSISTELSEGTTQAKAYSEGRLIFLKE
jgi:hypothetical protein